MSIANGDGLWADCLLPLKEGTAWRVREITSNDDWGQGLQEPELARLKAQKFCGKTFDFGVLEASQEILLVVDPDQIRAGWGVLAQKLGPIGLAIDPQDVGFIQRAVGFCSGVRQFDETSPYLVADTELAPEQKIILQSFLSGIKLIEAPTSLLGVEGLMCAGRLLGDLHNAIVEIIAVDELQDQYPAIHAVGRAAEEAPRLLHLAWGAKDHPRLCLVGKGVVFDSGGLNLKPGGSMALMRKDMGGAAFVLALASAIMARKLPVRLEVYVPAVENAIGPGALRPGDIMATRAGLEVEIGNTDAEGRLILADALALATEQEVDLLIDVATLTGAARVAMGFDLTPYMSRDTETRNALLQVAERVNDPLWPLPLWEDYGRKLRTPFADLNNVGDDGAGGAIIAACFLSRFCGAADDWLHLDLAAWDHGDRPGRRKGGAMAGWFSLLSYLEERYGAA